MGATAAAAGGGSVSLVASLKCCRLAPPPPRSELKEIRVCTHRSCCGQGSIHTLQTLRALAPPDVAVNPCGCLGRCGAGPNILALPEAILVGHCGTASRACQVMLRLTGSASVDDANTSLQLQALALRKQAETHLQLQNPNFQEAQNLLSQVIDLKPFGGIHIIFKLRSLARLGLGDYSGALEDVTQALNLAPNFTEAYICQGDIFLAMDQYDAADKSYAMCLEIEPSLRRSKSFKSRIAKLQERLTAANVP